MGGLGNDVTSHISEFLFFFISLVGVELGTPEWLQTISLEPGTQFRHVRALFNHCRYRLT